MKQCRFGQSVLTYLHPAYFTFSLLFYSAFGTPLCNDVLFFLRSSFSLGQCIVHPLPHNTPFESYCAFVFYA